MPEITQIQQEIISHELALLNKQNELQLLTKQLGKIDNNIANNEFSLSTETSSSKQTIEATLSDLKVGKAELENTKQSLEVEVKNIAESVKTLKEGNKEEIETDPFNIFQSNVGKLNDEFPILLFPLRIETRFYSEKEELISDKSILDEQYKKLTDSAKLSDDGIALKLDIDKLSTAIASFTSMNPGRFELWIRVYPDTCQIEIDRNYLTEAEWASAYKYAVSIESSSKITDETEKKAIEKNAFLLLVKKHGAGRATFIHELYFKKRASVLSDPLSEISQLLPPDKPDAKYFDEIAEILKTNRPPYAYTLPDRFIFQLFNSDIMVKTAVSETIIQPLPLGLHPSSKWLHNFDEAVIAGVGIKIPITIGEYIVGFEKLLVFGVKTDNDEQQGKILLENLFKNHLYSRNGLSVIMQGTPSNNSDDANAGYSWVEDPEETYATVVNVKSDTPGINSESVSMDLCDGFWLSQYLGIDDSIFTKVESGAGTDQRDARAMNVVLFPATIGYFFEEMLSPLINKAEEEEVERFFTKYVLGRGTMPSIRIGKQPYGILPVSPFSRLKGDTENSVRAKILDVIQDLLLLWKNKIYDVKRVTKDTPLNSEDLLNILSLQPNSVEFYQRIFEDVDSKLVNISSTPGKIPGKNEFVEYTSKAYKILKDVGLNPNLDRPGIIFKMFDESSQILKGPIIEMPIDPENLGLKEYLSELKGLRKDIRINSDFVNYIQWILSGDIESIRTERIYENSKKPLLYLLLRHAYLLRVDEAAKKLLSSTSKSYEELSLKTADNQVIDNIQKSRWSNLYSVKPEITGSATMTMKDFIWANNDPHKTELGSLKEHQKYLGYLADLPTAKLERALVEHIDCCSYRIDAWINGLFSLQLRKQRQYNEKVNEEWSKGIYLGVYGHLENLKSSRKSGNLGYILAPSTTHAAAGAILRNAQASYNPAPTTSNQPLSPVGGNPFTINLSSERVRLAKSIIEGIQNGQSLSALLGYRFERILHDKSAVAETDKYIYDFRKKYPLVQSLNKGNDGIDESISARNVVDGQLLLDAYRESPIKVLGSISEPDSTKINAAIQELLNICDALKDLVIAESVYQTVQSNYERGSAVMNAYSQGNYPTEFDIINTVRKGAILNHKVAMHFNPNADHEKSPIGGRFKMTPRAVLEPSVNEWLASILPSFANISCKIEFELEGRMIANEEISLKDLGLQPIDLLYVFNFDNSQSMTVLDELISSNAKRRDDKYYAANIKIQYTQTINENDKSKYSYFEIAALIRELKILLLQSRNLTVHDLEFTQQAGPLVPIEITAIQKKRLIAFSEGIVDDLSTELLNIKKSVETVLSKLGKNDFSTVYHVIKKILAFSSKLNLAGDNKTTFGFIGQELNLIYEGINKKINTIIERWQKKSDAFDELWVQKSIATNEEEKKQLLLTAERIVSTTTTNMEVLDLEQQVQEKGEKFKNKLNQFVVQKNTDADLIGSIQVVGEIIKDLEQYDFILFDVENQRNTLESEIKLLANLFEKMALLVIKVEKRIEDRAVKLKGINEVQHFDILLNTLRNTMGEDVLILSQFKLLATSDIKSEISKSIQNSDELLKFSHEILNMDFPVNEWLNGISKVREKMNAFESASNILENIGSYNPLDLRPIHLPYTENDRWLAIKFREEDESKEIDKQIEAKDKLLYTYYNAPQSFNIDETICGIIVDEWTEVVPNKEVTAGISFHYDRPNAEAPQTMLLVTPPVFTGKWDWKDIVGSIEFAFELAKIRAVEPDHLDDTSLAQFLPAAVMYTPPYDLSISTNLVSNTKAGL